jgi:hypothetical protein
MISAKPLQVKKNPQQLKFPDSIPKTRNKEILGKIFPPVDFLVTGIIIDK